MKNLLFFIITLLFCFPAHSETEKGSSWLVYYSNKAPLRAFEPYDIIVLDSKYHPNLSALKNRGKTLLGYISLGEAENHREYFNQVKQENILLEENKNWKGSFFVDVRSKLWGKRVIEKLIPNILRKGFDGIFIDTMDNPVYLEEKEPEKFKGMKKAAVKLIKAIRKHYPDMPIMVNRAYGILPDVAQYINMVLGESVYTDYNFETEKYGYVEKQTYKYQVNLLKKLKNDFPELQIMTLDYWSEDDKETIKKIYDEQRKNGFIPQVSVIKLDKIIQEPEL